jgi:glycosyltransferase involved in cell wall biosynthesis
MNNFHPLVSIVIPVYNGANYLQCAIDSALGQDYDNVEVIVVNDGSTDNTGETAKSYGDKIRYFSKENGGVATALNMAIQNSNGEYISWLSHDDYYLPNKISRQIEELEKIQDRNIIIFSDVEINQIKEEAIINKFKIPIDISHSGYLTKFESLKILFLRVIHGCSLLIPKCLFEEISYFNERLLTTQDYDLWFKFIKAGYFFYYLPNILLISRKHEQQVSIKKSKIHNYEKIKLFKSAYKTFNKDIKEADKEEILFFKNIIKEYQFINRLEVKIKMLMPTEIRRYVKTLLYKSS